MFFPIVLILWVYAIIWGICVVISGVIALAFHVYYRSKIRRAAREMNDETEERVSDGPELVDADPSEFHWLDQSFYDHARDQLAANGFHSIGDFENLTESRLTPYLRRYTRVMINDAGDIQAGIVVVDPIRKKMPLRYRWVPVASQQLFTLSSKTIDGVRLATSNVNGVLPEIDLPGLICQYLSPDTSIVDLLKTHSAAMGEILKGDPDVLFEISLTREDVIATAKDEHEWMKSCDAYHTITAAASAAQVEGDEDMQKAGRDIYEAYLRERERRRVVLNRVANV